MRKLLLMFLVSLSCFITPLSLYADNGDTETIADEETPEKGKKMYNQTYSCILIAGLAILGGCVVYFNKGKQEEVILEVNDTTLNDDGSMTVTLGYKNPNKKGITIDQNKLTVTQGSAIILKKDEIEDLEPGVHQNVLTAVINENTNLSWNVNGETISIDGKELLNMKGDK